MLFKKDIVERLANDYELTKKDAAEIYDMVCLTLAGAITEGEEVAIPEIGRVTIVEKPARTCRNPQTGEQVEVPAKMVPKFKFAKSIKDAVKEK